MKTVEIQTQHQKLNELLIKWLFKYILKHDNNFHFFYEPQLIIRTSLVREVTIALKKLDVKYKIYKYPYPNTRKAFGESKRWKYLQKQSENLYHTQAIFALTAKRKDMDYFSNRFHHCFLNMRGFEYDDEAKYYLRQAAGYMRHQYKGDGKLTTLILSKLIRLLYKML